MKILLPPTICSLLLFVVPTDSLACLCKPESTSRAVKRLKKEADAIFTGTVKSVTKEGREFTITLTVLNAWKSDGAQEITLKSIAGGCSAHFEAERTYLVYAKKDESGDLRNSVTRAQA